MAKGQTNAATRLEVLQGTLDLMVLQTLDSMGPQHGYGIARRLEQVSDDILKLNEGTVYTALMRLQHQRWISASWGTSENNRKAKFYAITRSRPAPAGARSRELGPPRGPDRPPPWRGAVLTCGRGFARASRGSSSPGHGGAWTRTPGWRSTRISTC